MRSLKEAKRHFYLSYERGHISIQTLNVVIRYLEWIKEVEGRV